MDEVFYLQKWDVEKDTWGEWEKVKKEEFLLAQKLANASKEIQSGSTEIDSEPKVGKVVAHAFKTPNLKGKIEYIYAKPKEK
jgi:hypothetical protein